MGFRFEALDRAMRACLVWALAAACFTAMVWAAAAVFPGSAQAADAESELATSLPAEGASAGDGDASPAEGEASASVDAGAPASDTTEPDAIPVDGDADGGVPETGGEAAPEPDGPASHGDDADTAGEPGEGDAPDAEAGVAAAAEPGEADMRPTGGQGEGDSAAPGETAADGPAKPREDAQRDTGCADQPAAPTSSQAHAPSNPSPAAKAPSRVASAKAASSKAPADATKAATPRKTTAAPKRAAAVANLKRGLYLLAADAKRTLVLAVSGDSRASGANVRILKANGKSSQLWWVLRAPKAAGAYIIESAHGGNVLEVAGGSKANGANIRVAACRNAGEQFWVPVAMSGGCLGFRNVKTGMMLAIAGGNAVAGANVAQSRALSAKAQALSPVKAACIANETDLGRALKSLRAKGVVVSGMRWAGSAGIPAGSKKAVTARGVAITGSDIAPQLVQQITLSPSYLLKGASNPQAAFDRITAAIKREGSTSGNVIYRVVLPRGTYKTKGTMHVYSNTWIDLTRGTTFKRAHKSGCMLRNGTTSMKAGGYGLSRNIIIQGGTFDANVRAGYKSASSTIRLGHCRNVLVKGVTFNQGKTHMVELSGVRDATVAGCAFKDNGSMRQWGEAVQIECVSTKKAASGFAPYDYTQCQNIVVERNRFTGVNRGVGNHSAVLGRYDNRVLVRGNVFTGLVNEAVDFPAVRHFVITGNRISKCGAGITVQATHPLFHLARKGIAAKVIPAAYGEIRNNTITTARRGVQVDHYCINLVGVSRGKAVYFLSHITLSGNRVKTCKGGEAVLARYARGLLVNGKKRAAGARYLHIRG